MSLGKHTTARYKLLMHRKKRNKRKIINRRVQDNYQCLCPYGVLFVCLGLSRFTFVFLNLLHISVISSYSSPIFCIFKANISYLFQYLSFYIYFSALLVYIYFFSMIFFLSQSSVYFSLLAVIFFSPVCPSSTYLQFPLSHCFVLSSCHILACLAST